MAHRLVQESTSDKPLEPVALSTAQISQLMAQMGRKGGKIGGKRRMATMTAEERSRIALKAAKARWKNQGKPR
jgi:hypothetical protein